MRRVVTIFAGVTGVLWAFWTALFALATTFMTFIARPSPIDEELFIPAVHIGAIDAVPVCILLLVSGFLLVVVPSKITRYVSLAAGGWSLLHHVALLVAFGASVLLSESSDHIGKYMALAEALGAAQAVFCLVGAIAMPWSSPPPRRRRSTR